MRNSSLVLFMCAGLLLSCGAILGGSTIWSLLRLSYYFWTTDLSTELASGVTFIAGSLLCLPVCWLASLVPYHPKSQPLFATLMCVSVTTMLILSVGQCALAGLTRALRDPAAVNASMHRAMALADFDPAVRSAFAAMQLELRCCGVYEYSDWYKHRPTLPHSCCGRLVSSSTRKLKAEPACDSSRMPSPTPGCLRLAIMDMRHYANALSALSSVIIMVLAVTVFAAAYSLAAGVAERQSHKPQMVRVAYLTPQPSSIAPYPIQPVLQPPAAVTP